MEGGHAVVFAGYRRENGQRQFLVRDSWGKDWADGGFAWISENAVRQFVEQAYKVVVADTSAPPPPPSAPTALTTGSGESQLVDAVTGQCADAPRRHGPPTGSATPERRQRRSRIE